MSKTKIALFGAGFIADIHLESYKRFVHDAEIRAIYSRSGERARTVAAHWGIPHWFDDIDRLIAEADCEVVDICLPNFLHHRVTLAAARAGKHVIIEKPLCVTLEEADEMIAVCRRKTESSMPSASICFFILPTPGRSPITPDMPPIFDIWLSCSARSSRSKTPFRIRSAAFWAFSAWASVLRRALTPPATKIEASIGRAISLVMVMRPVYTTRLHPIGWSPGQSGPVRAGRGRSDEVGAPGVVAGVGVDLHWDERGHDLGSLRGDDLAGSRLMTTRTWVEGQLGKVTIEAPDGVTLSGTSGGFNVSVRNDLDEPITVAIDATVDSGATIEVANPIRLAAHSRTSVPIDARMSRTGVHNVTLRLTDIEGTALGADDTLPLRTGQAGVVIWAIIGSGVGILFVAIAIRLVRRYRRRGQPVGSGETA